MRNAWNPRGEGMWCPQVHACCPHNEIAALQMRSLAPLPDRVFADVGKSVLRVFRHLRALSSKSAINSWSYLETAQSYNGRLRSRYLEAERSLRVDGPLVRGDIYLRPFLKAEKVVAKAKYPKPRLIYPRSPRYNLVLASRLKPLEHWLWGYLTTQRLFRCGVGRVVAKGLNQVQRANLIVRKFRALDQAVAFEVDGKAFEAHVGPSQLKLEHSVYKAAFPGDKELSRLLSEQLVLRGTLPCGARFSRPGGRASGDFNTGMGNSLIMLAVVGAVLRELVPGQFDLLVDGDNAVVFLPRRVQDRVMSVFAQHVLAVSGHEVTLERPVSFIEGIRFGQSAPVHLGPTLGWRMVRDPRKVMSTALASHRWLREPTFAAEWIRGVAACELSLSRGVPVLQAWALELQRQWGGPEGVRAHPHVDYFYQGAWLAPGESMVEVTVEARESFGRAFGLGPDVQLWMESCVENMVATVRTSGFQAHAPMSFDRFDLPPGLQ